jgi:hypothetical protein
MRIIAGGNTSQHVEDKLATAARKKFSDVAFQDYYSIRGDISSTCQPASCFVHGESRRVKSTGCF